MPLGGGGLGAAAQQSVFRSALGVLITSPVCREPIETIFLLVKKVW